MRHGKFSMVNYRIFFVRSRTKLGINLALSVAMMALCVYAVYPDHDHRVQLRLAVAAIQWHSFSPYFWTYLGLLLVVHISRGWRWTNLLQPIGVKLKAGPLMAISSVGFLAILALPARLGEFVRPGLLRGKTTITSAQALGTVAVERIVDGLMVSAFVFFAFFSLRGPSAPDWMMPTAYIAITVFGAAMVFLVLALRSPESTVDLFLTLSLLPRLAPSLARVIRSKLLEMIAGCEALRDVRNMTVFLTWSLLYWAANGCSLWVLAHGFGLPLSLMGAFATMGLVAVGISLPNAPGLVGQFQVFTLMGLQIYLGSTVMEHGSLYAPALAFAIAHHMLQVMWYTVMGAIAIATPWVSLSDLRRARTTQQQTSQPATRPATVVPTTTLK
jgi:glycosyltransferase 2 family protein